jgi:hypothetical protein
MQITVANFYSLALKSISLEASGRTQFCSSVVYVSTQTPHTGEQFFLLKYKNSEITGFLGYSGSCIAQR